MGYNTRPGLVTENEGILQAIAMAVENGQPLSFSVSRSNISSEQYRLRRLLKAAEIHVDELEGKYAGLGNLVTVRIFPKDSQIIVEPKRLSFLGSQSSSIESAIAALRNASTEFTILTFFPSERETLDELRKRATEIGWIVDPDPVQENDDGSLKLSASRMNEEDQREEDDNSDNSFSSI